ncbi:hypothetical protein BDB00DRAFT_771051 [Zychaea mexicana]|uniref:uncharacterized protein n=1 Tax=Zychaea mexicana TaxID=64656 RepID=UPI0022FE183C|nr:uncharacterized protein BDB00DRAFT_771051 [Zychaea mexicana]KAI9489256.1 hypothetical protein BDB00DRAFT_771051 [Zychaea mexicana]
MKYIVSDARRNKQNRLFRKILQETATDSYKLMGVSVVLAFEMCKVSKLRAADLDAITPGFLNHLLDVVESMVNDADETFNYDIIQLLLVFNEQFLMASKGEPNNKVLDVLTERIGTTNTFSANLIFMLNRSEVCDLGEEREAAALRDAYLRVLRPLLINTQLRRAPYKQTEIHNTLCAMITPRSYVHVDPATSRLVERILEEWWGNICKQPMAPLLGVDVKAPLLAASQHGTNAQVVGRSPSPYPMMRSSTSTSTSSNTSSTTESSPSSPAPTPDDNTNTTPTTNNGSSGQKNPADIVLCA